MIPSSTDPASETEAHLIPLLRGGVAFQDYKLVEARRIRRRHLGCGDETL